MKRYAVVLMVWLMVAVGCKGGSSDSETVTPEETTWESLATPIVADGHSLAAPLVDFLPDGRMVVADGNSASEIEIAVEKTAGSMTFTYVTSLMPPGSSDFGSFIKAVDDSTIIVGASTRIYTVALSTGACQTLAVIDNFDAALDGNDLYITRSTYNEDWSADGRVTHIDLDDPDTPVDVITGIDGYSAGVCLDDDGNLYTGNGYTNSGLDETGLIKRFALSALPQDWSAGFSVGDALSAGTLIWGGNGMLLVGGGDSFGSGEADYFAAIDTATGAILWIMDPNPAADSYYKLSAGAGRFAASIWNYTTSTGTIYLIASSALGL